MFIQNRCTVKNSIAVLLLCFFQIRSSGQAADDLAVKMTPENLGKVMTRLLSGSDNISSEDRGEMLEYSTRNEIATEHAILLLKVVQVSMGKLRGPARETRSHEAIRFAELLKASQRDNSRSDLEIADYAVLVYGVEDKVNGANLEKEYFSVVSKAKGDKRAELIGLLGNTSWRDVDGRLVRLKHEYESETSSQEARIAVIDSVFAGMIQEEVQYEVGIDFYASLSLSTWTSPQLNRKMFQRLSEVAHMGSLVKHLKKK